MEVAREAIQKYKSLRLFRIRGFLPSGGSYGRQRSVQTRDHLDTFAVSEARQRTVWPKLIRCAFDLWFTLCLMAIGLRSPSSQSLLLPTFGRTLGPAVAYAVPAFQRHIGDEHPQTYQASSTARYGLPSAG